MAFELLIPMRAITICWLSQHGCLGDCSYLLGVFSYKNDILASNASLWDGLLSLCRW